MKHVQNEFNIRLNVEYIPIVNVANMDGQTMQFEAGLRTKGTTYIPTMYQVHGCKKSVSNSLNIQKIQKKQPWDNG